MAHPPVIIIGAGIAGLSAARRLAAAGIPALVLDKGRGPGGRMATRRAGAATFDHGAQFFSAKTPDFQQLVTDTRALGIVREWRPGIPDRVHPRWIGATGMNALPKWLAESGTVLTGKRATRLELTGGGWRVITEALDVYEASALLITIPAPQALELLENSGIDLPGSPLREIAYHPCLACLATLDGPSAIPDPGGFQIGEGPIRWLADNAQKGISQQPSVTIHASPEFSRLHLDGDLPAAGQLLLDAAAPWIQPAQVTDWQVHRWRYSLAFQRHPEAFWQADTPAPLVFGGDGFGIGNVEGAYLSGLAMAEQVLEIRG